VIWRSASMTHRWISFTEWDNPYHRRILMV
jgi:hypothetical protein